MSLIEYYQQPQHAAFSLEHPDPDQNRIGVMLVHGFTGSPADMYPLARTLFDAGFDCHAPMHPGMGTDLTNLPSMTASIWRDASLAAWEAHTARYVRTILIGYSMGGAATMQMAATHSPNLLLLLAPFTRINDPRAKLLPLAHRMIREIRLLPDIDYDNPEIRQWFSAALPGLDLADPDFFRRAREESGISASVINELRKFGLLGLQAADGVHAPVAVIQGHQDTVVLPRYTRTLIDHFSNLVAYHEIPGDHLLPHDTVGTWDAVRNLVTQEIQSILHADPDRLLPGIPSQSPFGRL